MVGDAELIALQDSWTRKEPDGFFEGVDAAACSVDDGAALALIERLKGLIP